MGEVRRIWMRAVRDAWHCYRGRAEVLWRRVLPESSLNLQGAGAHAGAEAEAAAVPAALRLWRLRKDAVCPGTEGPLHEAGKPAACRQLSCSIPGPVVFACAIGPALPVIRALACCSCPIPHDRVHSTQWVLQHLGVTFGKS